MGHVSAIHFKKFLLDRWAVTVSYSDLFANSSEGFCPHSMSNFVFAKSGIPAQSPLGLTAAIVEAMRHTVSRLYEFPALRTTIAGRSQSHPTWRIRRVLTYFPIVHHLRDAVSERLRRWTRNPLGSARRGSNPLAVVLRVTQNCISAFPAD